jgi:hypothetical protein
MKNSKLVRCYIPVISALRRLKQENVKFKYSWGCIARPSLKKRKGKKENSTSKQLVCFKLLF